MIVLQPEPRVIEDERVKDLMFQLIAVKAPFDIDDLIGVHFGGQDKRLRRFLLRLEEAGLEIRKKNA